MSVVTDPTKAKRNLTLKELRQDPLLNSLETTETAIRWALEDHPSKSPYDTAAAKIVGNAIKKYGDNLAKQLGLISNDGSVLIKSSDPLVIKVIDNSISSRFHALHWETLEAVLSASGVNSVVTRSISPSSCSPDPVRQSLASVSISKDSPSVIKRSFNVLLVVSRAFKSAGVADINPFLGIEALLAARNAVNVSHHGSNVQVNIEISRPGTWHAFQSLIERRTSDWKNSGGKGPWYDIVHFDCHGIVREGKPSLLFLSRNGKNALAKSAQQVAQCLLEHSIRFVVLHACNSAEMDVDGSSNFARLLLENGLSTVVGMKYSFTSSAARIFVETFYSKLFENADLDMSIAIAHARATLRSNTTRLSLTNTAVDLTDFIVPVLYHRGAMNARDVDVHYTRQEYQAAKSCNASSLSGLPPVEDIAGLNVPIGREQDVVELEWILLRSQEQKVALLSGSVGVGKTALATFAGKWWLATGSISKVHYWDFKKRSLPSDLDDLISPLPSGMYTPKELPHLLILDHTDAILHPFAVHQNPVTDAERSRLREWILRVPGESLRVLIVGRSQLDWLDIPLSQRYHLKGLTDHDAFEYAMQQMSNLGPHIESMGGHRGFLEWNNDYMEYLVSRFNHNPLSITLFLDTIGKNRQISLTVTDTDHMNTHWCGIYPSGQKSLYDSILRGFVPLDPENEWVKESNLLIDKLFKYGLAQGNAFTLLAIAIPPNTYREEWHQMVCTHLSLELPGKIDYWNFAVSNLCGIQSEQHNPFNNERLDKFLSDCLIDTGWMETSEIVFADGSEERYYHVHPILTNQLRSALLAGRYSSNWPSDLFRKYSNYTVIWLNNIHNIGPGTIQSYQAKAEYLSMLAAIDTQLAWCSKEQPPGFPATARKSAQFMAYQICKEMVTLTERLQIPSFARDPAHSRIRALRDHLSASLIELVSPARFQNGLTTLDMLMEMYLLTCDYEAQHNPILAGTTASTCLVIIISICRRIQWSPWSRILLAKLLLFRGYGCYLARTRSVEARQAFEMAIRCRYQEASVRSILATTFLKQSPFEIVRIVARKMIETESSPCSQVIFTAVCEHRLAAFLGLLQTSKDLQYFYGEKDPDVAIREPTVSTSFFMLEKSKIFPSDTFPMTGIRSWIHKVVDDESNHEGIRETKVEDEKYKKNTISIENSISREDLMSKIDLAMRVQDRLTEISQRKQLVQLAIKNYNWEAAAGHILRIVDIERVRSGLPNLDARKTVDRKMLEDSAGQPFVGKEGSLRHQQFQAALYGSVFLRLNDFEHAYFFFNHVRMLRVGDVHAPLNFCKSWKQAVDRLLDDIRVSIFILASPSVIVPETGRLKSITLDQARELDNLMQEMIMHLVQNESLVSLEDFEDSYISELQAMVKNPYEWTDARIAAFCDLGLIHKILHFEALVHIDPQAVEERRIKDWLAAYPKQDLNLSPLEDGAPLSPVDPEAQYKGSLKHAFTRHKILESTDEVIKHHLDVKGASVEQYDLICSLFSH